MTLVEAESSLAPIETLSLIAWCRSRGSRCRRAAVSPSLSVVEGCVISYRTSPPKAPRLLYRLGDIRVVAGPIPIGVSMNLTDPDLGLIGSDFEFCRSTTNPF